MARPINLSPLPNHPAVNQSEIYMARMYGHSVPCLEVTCPFCGKSRLAPTNVLRQQLKRNNFLGACRSCYSSQPKAKTFRSSRNPSGKYLTSTGYVALGKNAIKDEDIDLFNLMRGKAGFVFEHRWVMAKHLGRALTSNELVDHMDGNKENNSISNLRIYIRGKQQPGSAPGHGTYYHELQEALLKIKELSKSH